MAVKLTVSMKPSKINMNQDGSQGTKRPLDISLLVYVIFMEKLTCISARYIL